MPLTYMVDMTGKRASRLHVHCPHHPDEHLVTLATWDGEQYILEHAGTVSEESVGRPAAADERREIDAIFGPGSYDIADSDDGERYFRLRLRCPRPSCGYHGQIRSTKFRAALGPVIFGMWHKGMPDYTITDLEAFTRGDLRLDVT